MAHGERAGGFGLIVIGSEILDGRVRDVHFDNAQALLRERRLPLKYSLFLPDDPEVIDVQLSWAVSRRLPFFCCGGIGSTPDDTTRGCAARVFGMPLEPHPEGVKILRERFGGDTTAARLRLVEFPRGAVLIPNPVNRVPGFRVGAGHFLPGFPEMARPMMAWVLDVWYAPGDAEWETAVLLPGAREADLVDLMEQFVASHPRLSFSSLPRFVAGGTEVCLGLSGPPAAVREGLADLTAGLQGAGVVHRVLKPPGALSSRP
jgi:molybdopterin-biosynthesis enzyme MoeA-like protein